MSRAIRIIFDDSIIVEVKGRKYVPLEVCEVLKGHWDNYTCPWEERFFELTKDGSVTYAEAAEVLTREGYHSTRGGPITENSLFTRMSNMKRRVRNQLKKVGKE